MQVVVDVNINPHPVVSSYQRVWSVRKPDLWAAEAKRTADVGDSERWSKGPLVSFRNLIRHGERQNGMFTHSETACS